MHKPTDIHEAFLEKVREIHTAYTLIDEKEDADLIVVDRPEHIDEIYRESVVVAVVGGIPTGHYPENVVFLRRREEIESLVRVLENTLPLVVH